MTDREDQTPWFERFGLRRRNLPERDACFQPGQAVLVKTDAPFRRRGRIVKVQDEMLVVEFPGGQQARVSAADVSVSRLKSRRGRVASG